MVWKQIPGIENYFICEKGMVLSAKYLEGETPNLDKAIKPVVQGKRSYVRIRGKGMDKKIPLAQVLQSLFPELLSDDLVIETSVGAWSVSGELAGKKLSKAARAVKPVRSEAAEPQEVVSRRKAAKETSKVEDEEDDDPLDDDRPEVALDAPDPEPDPELDDEDEEQPQSVMRRCAICGLRKKVTEFQHKKDMCTDCFLSREELMKEIFGKKRKMSKKHEVYVVERSERATEFDDRYEYLNEFDFEQEPNE